MSAPCFARVVNGHTEEKRGHQPLVDDNGKPQTSKMLPLGLMRSVDGVRHIWCVCRHCLALVLIPESELPQ